MITKPELINRPIKCKHCNIQYEQETKLCEICNGWFILNYDF